MPPARQLPPSDPTTRQRALMGLTLAALAMIGLALDSATCTAAFTWPCCRCCSRRRPSGSVPGRTAGPGAAARRVPGGTSGVVLGCLGLAFSALWLLVLAVFWPS